MPYLSIPIIEVVAGGEDVQQAAFTAKDELLELKVVLMNRQKQIKNLGARDEGLEQKMKVIDKLVGNVTIDKETAELISRG